MIAQRSFVRATFAYSFIVLLLVFSVKSLFAAQPMLPPHVGDIDASGVQNYKDALCYKEAVLAKITNQPAPACQVISDEAADLQCDGAINIVDLQRSIMIYRYQYEKNVLGKSDKENTYAANLKVYDQDLDMLHDDCDEDDATPWNEPIMVEPPGPLTDPNAIWPMFKKDQNHSGKSGYSGPSKNPTAKWQLHATSAINGSAVIDADGVIYIGSDEGIFYALNPDGTTKWEVSLEREISSSASLADNGRIYLNVGTQDTYVENGVVIEGEKQSLWAINSADGSLEWKTEISTKKSFYQSYSSPVIGPDGTIYVGSLDGSLYALDYHGAIKWKYETGDIINSSPAVGVSKENENDYIIYFGSLDGSVYAVNKTGELVWSYKTGGSISSSVVLGHSGVAYVHGSDGALYALDPLTGDKFWSLSLNTNGSLISFSTPAIDEANNAIYLGSNAGKFYAIEGGAKGGQVKWSFLSGLGKMMGSATVDENGNIYVASGDEHIYAFDSSGNLLWKFNTGIWLLNSAMPVIGANQDIYLTSYDGILLALQ